MSGIDEQEAVSAAPAEAAPAGESPGAGESPDGGAAPACDPDAVHAGQPAAALRLFTRFVGLDVHKRTVEGCVLDAAGARVHREEFACTPADLERFARAWGGPAAAAALEATSNTWAVCGILAPFFGKLKVSNPLKTKAIAQASVKTDKVDAAVLAATAEAAPRQSVAGTLSDRTSIGSWHLI